MVSPSSEKFYTVRRSRSIQSSCFLKIRQHAKIYTVPRILTLDGLIKLYWESESTSRHLRRSEVVSTSKVSNCCYRRSRKKNLRFGLSVEWNDLRSKWLQFWHILYIYVSLSCFSKDCVWLSITFLYFKAPCISCSLSSYSCKDWIVFTSKSTLCPSICSIIACMSDHVTLADMLAKHYF